MKALAFILSVGEGEIVDAKAISISIFEFVVTANLNLSILYMPNPGMPSHLAPGNHPHRYHPIARGRRRKSTRKKSMKKTTRKGAYKPARKKQMMIRRAPLVETLKYQSYPANNHVQALSRTVAYNNVMNDAFIAGFRQELDVPNDGVSTSAGQGPTCKGRDVFYKVSAMKLKFTFPQNIFSIRTAYAPPEVIHGWVKKTMFKTSLTVPTPTNVTRQHFIDLINASLTAQFNENNDKLDFADRRPTEYVILGRRKIRPNRNKSISQFQQGLTSMATTDMPDAGDNTSVLPTAGTGLTGAMSVLASMPPVYHTVRWRVNRKIGLQRSTAWEAGASPVVNRFFPSDSWVPFCIVFNPSFAQQTIDTDEAHGTRGQIVVANNSVLYYTDS